MHKKNNPGMQNTERQINMKNKYVTKTPDYKGQLLLFLPENRRKENKKYSVKIIFISAGSNHPLFPAKPTLSRILFQREFMLI